MDRYQRVEKTRAETAINENEIRITALGRMRNYISYATTLLQEKGSNEIIIKAMGRAISKTVMIAELIKRRIVGLHQVTTIESTDITDVWEPLEEGLLPLETIRRVSMITITLSKNELNTSSPGYQPPIPVDQVKPLMDVDNEGERLPSGRGRGYGNRGRGYGDRGRGRVGGISGMGITNREAGDGEDGGRGYGGRGRGPPGEDEGWDGGRGYSGRGRGPPGEDEGWDGGRGYGGRGRGRGRARGAIRGGRGYGDGNGGRYMRREQDEYDDGDPDFFPPQGRGEDEGWDGGRGYGGRGRGRGRARGAIRGGRGYGDGNGGRYMRREQDEYDDGDPDFFPPQGRGRGKLGRGRGRGRGRASGRG